MWYWQALDTEDLAAKRRKAETLQMNLQMQLQAFQIISQAKQALEASGLMQLSPLQQSQIIKQMAQSASASALQLSQMFDETKRR